ncbi:ELOV6 protein, partial [Nothoprocta ornata]|nr:ELOV6 protein [Nothoprocta pentlandii]NWY03966.1 ELOV6 protein [Nothoprocta ornata]
FEQHFDERGAVRWMQDNWQKAFSFPIAYLILIFGIQHIMKERTGYKLRTPLVVWSLGLALFSAIGAHRTWKYIAFVISTEGFRGLVCDQTFYVHHIAKLWAYLFVMSKVLELGDTVFIVLRKKTLIFLHWYHHITTLICSWLAYKQLAPGGGLLCAMNFTVHTFMYSYYAMRAAGLWVPRYIAIAITLSQILQMLLAVVVNILVFFWMEQEVFQTCWSGVLFSLLMYFSYLVLFCNFFYKTYLTTAKKSKGE